MTKSLFALVDCNNFFVSCERLFRPDLQDKPVVVLSSNDGCVVARSNEAKALGIPMGAPVFKCRDIFNRYGVVQFSANFELYGDVSRRITAILASITPRLEIYSIDEAFLDLSELHIASLEAWGREVRKRILQWTGMPVAIGIAPTKTLAKLASECAKTDYSTGGVLSFSDQPPEPYLQAIDVQKVWGIGWRLAPKLRAEGISNALQLTAMRPQYAEQLMGIRGRQTITELSGEPCFQLELEHKARQTITRTRTFGHDTNDLLALQAAIATFVTRAAFRLRQDNQLASRIGLFLTTNRKKPGYQSWDKEILLTQPTADTGQLLTRLVEELQHMHRPYIAYHRAGIWLGDFSPADRLQTDLLGSIDIDAHDQSQKKMHTLDSINKRFGKGKIGFASAKLAGTWEPLQANKSPNYTTSWADLPSIGLR